MIEVSLLTLSGRASYLPPESITAEPYGYNWKASLYMPGWSSGMPRLAPIQTSGCEKAESLPDVLASVWVCEEEEEGSFAEHRREVRGDETLGLEVSMRTQLVARVQLVQPTPAALPAGNPYLPSLLQCPA